MVDSAQATEYLTSMLKGFKLEASEATDAVSMLTALDMDFAASAGDIAEALSRMATSAQLAGMSIQEAAAAVTVIKDVSQKSASSIGESIKTLLSRYGNVKAGSFVDLETGEADESLNDTEKVLNALNISIRSSSMEFRSFSDVLDDVAEKWVSLSTVEKNAVATAMAGTRQRENFNILMENYDSYKKAIDTASDSQGTAEEKYGAYMDSIEAHLNKLKDAWDELAQNFEGSAFFKGLVDVATFLVENLPKIIKLFATLFASLNAYKLPVAIKQLGGALNPFRSVAAGKYAGFDKGWTIQGMSQRMMKRELDYQAQTSEAKAASEQLFGVSGTEFNYTPTIDASTNKIVASQDKSTASIQTVIKLLQGYLYGKADGGFMTSDKRLEQGRPRDKQRPNAANTPGVAPGYSRMSPGNAKNRTEEFLASKKKKTSELRDTVNEYNRRTSQAKEIQNVLGGKAAQSSSYLSNVNGSLMAAYYGPAKGELAEALDQLDRQGINVSEFLGTGLGSAEEIEQARAVRGYFANHQDELAAIQRMQSFGSKTLTSSDKALIKNARTNFQQLGLDSSLLGSKSQVKGNILNPDTLFLNALLGGAPTSDKYKDFRTIQDAVEMESDLSTDRIELNDRDARRGRLRWNNQSYKRRKVYDKDGNLKGTEWVNKETGEALKPNSAGARHLDTAATQRKSIIKTRALTGVVGGLTAGVTAAATQEGDATDKFVAGATNAVTTGLLSAIPGVGQIIGPILGPILGDWISGALLDYIHREDIAREKRVEEANKYLESLTSIKDSVSNIESLNNNRENWDSSDWGDLNDYIRETMSILRENDDLRLKFEENAAEIDSKYAGMSASELMQIIQTGSQDEADQLILALKNAQTSESLSATFASQEEERHTIQENIDDIQALGKVATMAAGSSNAREAYGALGEIEGISSHVTYSGDTQYRAYELEEGQSLDDQLETLKKARAEMESKALEAAEAGDEDLESSYKKIIETLDDNIDVLDSSISELANMNDELNDISVEETVNSTIGTWDNTRIANATLEEAIYTVAQDLSLYGEAVYDAAGRITDEARTYIESFMRENDKFSSLFEEDDTVLRRLLQQADQRTELLANTGYSYEDLREAFDYKDEEMQQAILKAINDRTETQVDNIDLETLTNLVYKLDPQNLENYAEALGMTVDEVAELKNVLGNTSLADLLGDPQDTLDEISEKVSILSDYMSNGAVSAENYFKILSQYTELLYEYDEKGNVIGIGTENITKNLMDDLYGSEGNLGTLLGYQTYEEAKTNSNLYDAFKEIVKNRYQGSTDLGFLETSTTFNDDILAKLNQDQELWALYSETMEGIMVDTSEYQTLVQSIIDYQSTMIDQEIEGLQSVQDALEATNNTRQKELDLIKAKDALENAKNEKKLVYRAGVGFTYESDQTAVQEAQQNLEDLETDKKSEDLQYQIDQLEQSKAFLEAIPSSEELNAQKETYQAWMDKITENGEKQADILSELGKAYTEISNIGEQMSLWVSKDEEVKSDADKAAETLINNTGEGTEDAISAAIGNVTASEGTQEYQGQMQKVQDQIALWEENLQKSGIGNFMDYDTLEEAQANGFTGASTQEGFDALKNQYSAMKSGKYDKYKNANTDVQFIELPNGEKFTVDPSATDSYWATSATQLITAKLDDNSAFNNASGKGTDRLYVWNDTLKDWGEKADDGGKNQHGADEGWDIDPQEITNLPDGTMLKSVSNNATNYAYKYSDDLYLKAYPANREGTSDFEGGGTLINEEGTEGIITPQGTLTALPAHTGIVPADLTRNLFELGEVAPNLVKQLSSLNYEYPTSTAIGNMDDHSTNINSLYATFQVDENFDFDQFLSEVRGTINTSRHNG